MHERNTQRHGNILHNILLQISRSRQNVQLTYNTVSFLRYGYLKFTHIYIKSSEFAPDSKERLNMRILIDVKLLGKDMKTRQELINKRLNK